MINSNIIAMDTSTMVPMSTSSMAEEEGMDWYAWLSTAGLEPTVAYEYSLLFAHNELDQDDVPHLDHTFLLSMGVSVGKHRLQILQLAQKECRRRPSRPVARLLAAAVRARTCLSRCLRSLAKGDGSRGSGRGSAAAFVAAQRDLFGGGGGQHWRSAMLKRERKLALLRQGRLMLTDGGVRVAAGPPPPPPTLSPSPRSASLSPLVFPRRGVAGAGEDKLWGGGAGEGDQERRWDFMFQDLKPT